MNKIFLGKIEEMEKERVRKISEQRIGLEKVVNVLNCNEKQIEDFDVLLPKAKSELSKCQQAMDKWWIETSKKYHWCSNEKDSWEIIYHTNEVFLVSHNKYD